MSIITPKFRVAYPNVFEPRMNNLSKRPEYSVVALFPKDADLTKLKIACEDACKKKWGQDPKEWPRNLRTPFRKQEERMKKGVLPPGHVEGAVFLNLRSKNKPAVVSGKKGADGKFLDITEKKDFYSGAWAVASVGVYTYDQGGNVGVNIGLNNVQKVSDGETLGGATRPEEDFEAFEDVAQGASSSDLFT